MTEYDVDLRVESVNGERRVSFVGTGTFRIPDQAGRDLVAEARERFDIESLPEQTTLATIMAADDPKHRVVDVEWYE